MVPVELRGSTNAPAVTGPSARIVDRERDPDASPAFTSPVPAPRVGAPDVHEPLLAEPARLPASLSAATARARTALGLGPVSALVQNIVEVVVEVDADGVVLSSTQRTVWRVLRPGAARVGVVELGPEEGAGRPVVEAVAGCSTGRTYVDLREGVFVTALELPSPVEADQTCETRHRICLAGGLDTRQEVVRRLDGAVGTVRLEVRFDPARQPTSGTASLSSDQGEVSVSLPVLESRLVWSGTATSACSVGLRWHW